MDDFLPAAIVARFSGLPVVNQQVQSPAQKSAQTSANCPYAKSSDDFRVTFYHPSTSHYLGGFNCGDLQHWSAEEIRDMHDNDRRMIIAVCVDKSGIPIGYAAYRIGEREIFLLRIIVDENHRGKGVASKMFRHCLGKLDRRRRLMLVVIGERATQPLTFMRRFQPDVCRLIRHGEGDGLVQMRWVWRGQSSAAVDEDDLEG